MMNEPLEIDEEILAITEEMYTNKLHANDRTLLMITEDLKLENDHQELDRTFIYQVAEDLSHEPDLVWIKGTPISYGMKYISFQEFLDTICAGISNTLGLIDDIFTMGQEFVEAITILEA